MSTTHDLPRDDTPALPPSYPVPDPEDDVSPINWLTLTAQQAEAAYLDLNKWVNWLRHAYGLPPTVIPPLWHRHDELIWELSALHTHWLYSYDPVASPSAPNAWHRDFAETRNRLREWVSTCGTKLDRDRPTRQAAWPGEPIREPRAQSVIVNRDQDFVAFVIDDISRRNPTGPAAKRSDSTTPLGEPPFHTQLVRHAYAGRDAADLDPSRLPRRN